MFSIWISTRHVTSIITRTSFVVHSLLLTKVFFKLRITESMRSLGKPGYRQKDNLKIDYTEIVWEYSDWIHLTRARGSNRLLFTWL